VVKVTQKVVFGDSEKVESILAASAVSNKINTSYIPFSGKVFAKSLFLAGLQRNNKTRSRRKKCRKTRKNNVLYAKKALT
jgi:hypothetical protein